MREITVFRPCQRRPLASVPAALAAMVPRLLAVALTATLLTATGPVEAAPPSAPTNESPADGTVDVAAAPSLCVDVSDPDGGFVEVTFRGRRVTGESFTIVALPDTQFYSRDNPAIFDSQTQWIVDNREAWNIAFVTHLGDIVQNGNNVTQWNNANGAMSLLDDPVGTGLPDGIPFGVAPGNHDQAPLGAPRSGGNEGGTTGQYNARFGVDRFEGRAYWGDHYDFGDPAMYANNNDNNYELFTAGGMDFIIVHLEYDQAENASRTAVLNWLDSVLMAHADRRAIIMTHYMISQFALFSNQGQAIYDTVKDNPNVFLMLGGHITGGAQRTDVFQGSVIYSLLSDYQSQQLGGGGYMRLMEFRPESDEIRVRTYSPWFDAFDLRAAHDFTLDYAMDGPVPFETIARVNAVPSGATVCAPWTGRRDGVDYEWSVDVSDGTTVTESPRWRFRSDGGCASDADCADRDACSEDTCAGGTCAGTEPFDGDGDGVCEDVDNCARTFNVLQSDTDGDGLGDVCDRCPDDFDPSQLDGDGDDSPDACDCQSVDGGDRVPAAPSGVRVSRGAGPNASITWTPTIGTDAYSVTRGELSTLAASDLGDCLAEGVLTASLDDPDVPSPGDGFFYLVQGQNFDCGLGGLGFASDETERSNLDPGACLGAAFEDAVASGETTRYGERTGSFSDTHVSDDVHESISEEISNGSPDTRHSRLEHTWELDVTGGRVVELHVEAFRRNSTDGDDFVFEYSTDGGSSWIPAGIATLPTADGGADFVATLPPSVSGEVLVRVLDTNRTPGTLTIDWVSVDELWIRSVP